MIVFLIAAVLCGGAGAGYPLVELALELLAMIVIARSILGMDRRGTDRALWLILSLFLAADALLVLQLVPLPPSLWHALPDRATATSIYAVLGWERNWHAFSLTPDLTARDLVALLPALAGFLGMALASNAVRLLFLRIVTGIALLGTIFAIVQVVVGGADAPVIFATAHRGFGVGFFVNRNHQATLLLVAILLVAVPGVVSFGRAGGVSPTGKRLAMLGIMALLALGVLATSSRTGLVLLPPTLLIAVGIVFDMRQGVRWLIGAGLLYGISGLLLYRTPLVQQVLERFATVADDQRYQYWRNTGYAIRQAMPWGTGLGSFDTIYRSVEPLAQLTPLRVNNAHNDYLEFALEGGLPAILLIAAGLAILILCFVRAWRRARSRSDRATIVAAAVGAGLILLFSIVDYPLRMTAIGVVFGLLLGCAVRPPACSPAGQSMTRRNLALPLLLATAAAALGYVSLTAGIAMFLLQRGDAATAAVLTPWSAQAWTLLANRQQAAGRPAASGAAALRALRIAPLDDGAVRALGYAEIARNRPGRGDALLQLGAALGWHDTQNQLWLVEQSLRLGNVTVAVERIDGMLRRGLDPDGQPHSGVDGELLLRQLRVIFRYPGGSDAIADRLAENPPWRQGFLNAVADDSPQVVPQILHLLARLRAAGAPVDERATALIRWHLADAGDYRAAVQVWRRSGGQGLIADGDFAMVSGVVPAGAAPFAWRAPALPGVHVSAVEAEGATGTRSVVIASDGLAAGPVLSQTIALVPGTYRLLTTLPGGSADTGAAVTWTLSCLPSGAQPATLPIRMDWLRPAGGLMRGSGIFTVPQTCPGQLLSLAIGQGAGQPFAVHVSRVSVGKVYP
ncbi:hypothetical protein BH10PSE14_BH10PSE14_31700 [soil metagenome]